MRRFPASIGALVMVPASAISSAIQGAASFPGGATWPLLCNAIGNAVSTWAVAPGNVLVQGVSTGVVGAGTVTGLLQFSPDPATVSSVIQGAGLAGTTVSQLGTALTLGMLSSLNGSLQYQGVSAGVAQGLDVSLVATVNTATLITALQSAHSALASALGGSGASNAVLYSALAAGIATIFSTGTTLPGTGIVTPAGPLGPASSVGATVSVIV